MRVHPLHTEIERPERLNNPFDYEPHPLCILAAEEVKQIIVATPEIKEDADRGKMFGVLVVELPDGKLAYLAAYSGLLAGRNDWDDFVPPVFDAQQPDGYFKQEERRISAINEALLHETDEERIQTLRKQRKQMSENLQTWLFEHYRVYNSRGESRNLVELWQAFHPSPKIRSKYPLPPAGSGDCCAPKLLQYAFLHGLRPVNMAEFWWGAPPKMSIRHQGQFYTACRGKCMPILTFMLQGLEVEDTRPKLRPRILRPLYEDAWLVVVSKPSGMLSVPAKFNAPSVFSILRQQYPEATGPLMVHRLDMGTSGLLIVAKTKEVHKLLQEQFRLRQVKKKYIAILDGELTEEQCRQSEISLPMRLDPLDRPRQVVDHEHGKTAITKYEVLSVGNRRTRIALYPQTGRTHQLRVHCAHPEGLNCPIRGDILYGRWADRLYLHAAEIWFTHPITGEWLHIEEKPEW